MQTRTGLTVWRSASAESKFLDENLQIIDRLNLLKAGGHFNAQGGELVGTAWLFEVSVQRGDLGASQRREILHWLAMSAIWIQH